MRILGHANSIDLAVDRKRFSALLSDLNITQPASGTAIARGRARSRRASASRSSRPSCARRAGGRSSTTWPRSIVTCCRPDASPEHPVLIDKFLEDAFEFDVDDRGRHQAVVIGGIMEHIEEAGIHSGDSSCVVPPFLCPERHSTRSATTRGHRARAQSRRADERQYVTKDDGLRARGEFARVAHRPYLSATGVSLAKVAAKVMAGRTLAELGLTGDLSRRRLRQEPGVPSCGSRASIRSGRK